MNTYDNPSPSISTGETPPIATREVAVQHHLWLLRWSGLLGLLALVLILSQAASSPRSAAAQGSITISPATWDFGPVQAGVTATKDFTITNNGPTTATVTSWQNFGPNFLFVGGNCPNNGGQLAPGASCTMTGGFAPHAVTGVKTGFLGIVFDTGSVAANLTASGVAGPPMLGVGFGNNSGTMALNDSIGLSFFISQQNAELPLTGVGFGATLPAGLVVATPNGLSTNCGSGLISATAASSTIGFSSASLAPFESCSITVMVKATSLGVKTVVTTAPTSVEAGNGVPTSTSITVLKPAATIAALKNAVNNSAAGAAYKMSLTNLLNTAQTYLSMNTPSGNAMACSMLNSFKMYTVSYSNISQVSGISAAMATAWNSFADTIRATIPC